MLYNEPIMGRGDKKKKHLLKIRKNGLPVLDSDQDFLRAFERENEDPPQVQNDSGVRENTTVKNKHGVPVLDTTGAKPSKPVEPDDPLEEDFETLLNEYYQTQPSKSQKKETSLSLKKRLKRYPPVERELDLHGYTGMAAQMKLSSFLHTCKNQGFFTVRVIVGKGLHSEHGPVIPDIAQDLLVQLRSQNVVLWYEWENKRKRNSGALTVYLKQFDQYD